MTVQNITTMGVAGAGTMGSGVAQLFARRGYDVRVMDLAEDCLDKSARLVALYNSSLVEQGIMTEREAERTVRHISYHLDQSALHDADVIVETIVEKLDAKQVFWERMEAIAGRDALFTTNTSGLSINAISAKVKNKGRFIGMHFWNPPHIVPLVELIRADETEDKTVDVLRELLNIVDKAPVVVQKDAPGFIGNRLQFAVFREALHLVEEGIATADDVDRAMRYGPGFRYPILGPLQTADLGGLDIFCSIASYLFGDLSDMKEVPDMLKRMIEAGRLGVKSGRGFYDYSNGKDVETIKQRDAMFLKMLKHIYPSQEGR